MSTTSEMNAIFQPLAKLKEAVTEQSVRSLRTDQFPHAQAFLQIGQELKELELRLRGLITGAAPPTAAPAVNASRSARTYPRYVRNGEILAKIGQRRDRKGTYEQKVDREAFDQIVGALREIAGEEPNFEAASVIQSVSLPSYQVYLVMGFLQEYGLIDSPSRGRYRLSLENISKLAQAWELASTKA